MLVITYLTAILAAMLNASSSVIQRWATAKPEADKLFGRSFAYKMLKSKLFLIGFTLQVTAFISQAIALKNGPLIIVEPLLTCDLIFLLVIIHWRLDIRMRLRDWIAAIMIMGGLTGLFAATNPQEGHLNYQAEPWIILVSIAAPVIIALAVVIRHLKSPQGRASLAALAAAAAFALNAAFTKLSLNLLTKHGVIVMLTSWPIFALIVSGLVSLYLMLNAYGSGPLAISQPIMEVVEPAAAVIIGVMIFGDSYNSSIAALAIGLASTLVLIAGIVSLGSSPRLQQAGERGI